MRTRSVNKLIRGALALFVCAALLCVSAAALTAYETETELAGKTVLASGVYYVNNDRQAEHRLEYEPNSTVKPVVVYGSKVCNYGSFSSMASLLEKRGMNVIGGINGDYYVMSTYQPLGMVVSEGELKSSDAGHWAVGFRGDGTAFIGRPALEMSVSLGGQTYVLAGVNKVRSGSGYHLFTEDFSYTTKNTAPGWDAVLVPAAEEKLTVNCEMTFTVESVNESRGDMTLPEGRYVLSLASDTDEWRRAGMETLAPGDKVTVKISSDRIWDEAEYAVGSLTKLVTDGVPEQGLERGEQAPRSAVGIRPDGTLVLFSVDGRQNGYSRGYTVEQLAERLAELGCAEACLMDGGGSTALSALYIGEESAEIAGRPSGGYERSVSTYIMLAAQGPGSGTVRCLGIRPESAAALKGASVGFTVGASDETGRAVPAPDVYVQASGGTVSGNAVRCDRAGTVTLSARYGQVSASAEIISVETPDSISVTADGRPAERLFLPPGAQADLDARAVWMDTGLISQDSAFSWSATVGSINADGVFTAPAEQGSGSISAAAGGRTVTVSVTVCPVNTLLESFESTGTNSEPLYAASGRGAARLYRDLGTGDSYTWSFGFREAPYAQYTHISVYGDGSGNILYLTGADGVQMNVCRLDFTGLKRFAVACPDPAGIGVQGSGLTDICVDSIVASSSGTPDTEPPVISGASLSGGAFSARVDDACDGDRLTLSLTLDGRSVPYTYENGTVSAYVSAQGLHKLTLRAEDISGNRAEWGTLSGTAADAFTDIENHWARDYANYAASSGMMTGTGNGCFEPDSVMTRELFARAVCVWMDLDTNAYAGTELTFADADEIAPECVPYVRAAYSLGILKGADVGGVLYFLPDDGLTRAQAMTVIGRIQGMGYADAALTFADSADIQDWSRPYIAQLAGRGVIIGYNDGRIDPNGPLTRGQVAKILTLVM